MINPPTIKAPPLSPDCMQSNLIGSSNKKAHLRRIKSALVIIYSCTPKANKDETLVCEINFPVCFFRFSWNFFFFSLPPLQIGDEMNGMIMVRSADNRQGVCPAKYLQDV
jgi:hypothetical protein